MKKPTTESRLIAKLRKLYSRRDYHAWRLGDVDRQIKEATGALARERRILFLRPDVVREQIEAADRLQNATNVSRENEPSSRT